MTDNLQRIAAKKFADTWKGKGYEKGESQKFWLALLRNVYGIEEPENFIVFEDQVHLDHTSFIDGIIPSTHVLIEQKGLGKDLRKPIKQSDGTLLKPIQQAKRYAAELPYSQRPRWIVTCNFSTFLVYDMENPANEPEEILLENLPTEYYRLAFLVDTGNEHLKREMEISIQAGEIVGLLYDEILKQYLNPANEESLKSLNMLCVRLVFCLYAEDADIFGKHSKFYDYLSRFEARDLRRALIDLFKVLDTKPENRDPYMDPLLASFPYVNGGLFSDENIEIPQFNEKIKELLLEKSSDDFNWSEISPTIFGAVFESTLNPETRRSGGMHYTSIENIHKVIDPLFLDDLRKELEDIKSVSVDKTREKKLKEYQAKLGSLQFLDPACGSGNFLTETYLSLRRLENKVLEAITYGQIGFTDQAYSPIQVSISQFYGIEINDFAVTVAKTALWIAESQMMKETENVIHISLDFLPLKSYANIIEANALQLDWESVVPKENVNYIMGNPPFIGASMMTKKQKSEAVAIFGKIKLSNSIDYVGAWYHKAAAYIQSTQTEVAFVSTNSITQGEQVAPLWKKLIEDYKIQINFAYRTFKWDSEAKEKAAVHCVIIGFSGNQIKKIKKLYLGKSIVHTVNNISPYLLNSPNILISSKSKPICDVPPMFLGNKPTDGGNFIIDAVEKKEILNKEPDLEKFIYPYIGATEFINNKIRYCFWLKDAAPIEICKSKELSKRVEAVREKRLASSAKPTREKASTPQLFFFISQPNTDYLLIPSTSSENRRYIPIGFMTPDIIASNSVTIIPNATLYHFGILTSNVHMAWMRTIAGRLKSDYRYSTSVVYNNFPWPSPTAEQRKLIENTAKTILTTRSVYKDSPLSIIYGPKMHLFSEVYKAHQLNDRAVMQAYGLSVKDTSEAQCVAELMRLYQKLISSLDS